MINPWYALGVHRQSSDEDIRLAFINIAKLHHPDASQWSKRYSMDVWQAANTAYAILKDGKKRSAFIKEMMIVCAPCAPCKAAGVLRKGSGLVRVTLTPCANCQGAGAIIKKTRVRKNNS